MKQPYAKPALTLDQQVEHLRAKGMGFVDEEAAKRHLKHISYYRLSAYWLPFEYPKEEQELGKCFRPGTDFATVVALHEFDRVLRRLVLEAVEEVEISLCGNWAYQMAMLGDGFSYLDPAHCADTSKFNSNRDRLKKEIEDSKETFVIHFRSKYAQDMPPVWMASEVLSFGSLSHWYANLKEPAVRKSIAEPFGLDETVFKPFIHHLSVVRNTCAHHSRLWNRVFKVQPKLPRKPTLLAQSLNESERQKIYNTLALLVFVLDEIGDSLHWKRRLIAHLETLPHGNLSQMGFPDDWKGRAIWATGGAT